MIGVYLLFLKKKVVYIGQTTQWPVRLSAHKGINFTDARLIECKKSELSKYEARLIEIFKPKCNFMHTPKSVNKKLTDEWVLNNNELIEIAINESNDKVVYNKAMTDLGFSPRYSRNDLMNSIVGRHNRLTKR